MPTVIEDRLAQLRVRWKAEPQNRIDIENEVARLKGGLKLPAYIPPKENKSFVNSVKESLF